VTGRYRLAEQLDVTAAGIAAEFGQGTGEGLAGQARNRRNAAHAAVALAAYAEANPAEADQTQLEDLLADLGHLADLLGLDFDYIKHCGDVDYRAEIDES
jgi:hypothetical protein